MPDAHISLIVAEQCALAPHSRFHWSAGTSMTQVSTPMGMPIRTNSRETISYTCWEGVCVCVGGGEGGGDESAAWVLEHKHPRMAHTQGVRTRKCG